MFPADFNKKAQLYIRDIYAFIDAAGAGDTDKVLADIEKYGDRMLNCNDGAGGYTALMNAVVRGQHEMVILLLNHGAITTQRNNGGKTVLDMKLDEKGEACRQIILNWQDVRATLAAQDVAAIRHGIDRTLKTSSLRLIKP